MGIDFSDGNFLNALLEFFERNSIMGFLALVPHAKELLTVLGIIDICATWALYDGYFRMSEMIGKVMKIGFFVFLLAYFPDINSALLRSFQMAGLTGAGMTISADMLGPSNVLDMGFTACKDLFKAFHEISIMSNGGLGKLFMYLIAMFFTIAAFFFMAFQILLTKIEFNIFASLGVILLPFGVLRQTSFMFQRMVSAVFAFGVKLMVMYFMVGLTLSYMGTLSLSAEEDFAILLKQSLAMFTLGLLVWKIPSLAANIMSGTPTLDAGNVLSSTLGSFTGALAGSAAGAGVLSSLAGSASGLAKTYAASRAGGAGIVGALGSTATYAAGQYFANRTRVGRNYSTNRDFYDSQTGGADAPPWFRQFKKQNFSDSDK
ncbi:MAG: P-type conjugative transfer protein TrbL [Phascolarctobacterium sp.]|nr:MAG: P-type conjugative transfer protein TrbL [Phascolarctobacterium sp.]